MSHTGLVNVAYGTMGTALLSVAVVTAVRSGVRSTPPAGRAMYASLGVLGVSFLVQSPAARAVQDGLLVNLGQLTGNGTTLVSAFAARAMVLFLRYDDEVAAARTRRRIPVLVAVAVAMTALFLATPMAPDRFVTTTPPGGILLYYALFTGYLTLTVGDLLWLALRNAARMADPVLRTGLHLLAGTCVAAVAYLIARLGVLAGGWSGLSGDRLGTVEFFVATFLPGIAATLAVGGIVLGLWGRHLRGPVSWTRDRRSYRRLRPLWEAARDARPDLVLPLHPGAGGRLRLYRRIIEIQDAQLAARTRVPPAVRRDIAAAVAGSGLAPDAAAAVTEAAVFAAGLRADPTRAPVADATPATAAADPDFPSAVARLELVSAAYRSSPIVRRFTGGP